MVFETLKEQDIRGLLDDRDEKIGRKIRDAETKKIPYMLIVGETGSQGGPGRVTKTWAGRPGKCSACKSS